jgi:hypothetical protein
MAEDYFSLQLTKEQYDCFHGLRATVLSWHSSEKALTEY